MAEGVVSEPFGLFGGYGLNVPGGQVYSTGTPNNLNRLAAYSMVQEQPMLWGNPLTNVISGGNSGPVGNIWMRFTGFQCLILGQRVPAIWLRVAATDLPDYMRHSFQYSTPTTPNTPYILFVHGWNLETLEKDRYSETAFKRLYGQRYQGRFGEFRWPTGNGFPGIIGILADARNYDNSENVAWKSAVGLLNLLVKLNGEYSGNVYLMAHSMGDVVAGEALRLATS